MENTGLVTYRETLLLMDPALATHEERVDVAETVAHELAHMWFGDLVTMRWWNGIWLNEAFATFMASLCVEAMEPDWRVFEAFQTARMVAFEVDSLETTRPIEFPVESPDDASGMFDTLTYTKGGAVLRMIEQWLGPERFRDGIRQYLAAHAYGNTETHDLWDALEAASGQPVRRIMDAWIFQAGYPAVEVSRDADTIRFTQHRFAPSLPDDDTGWPIPLIVRQETPDGPVEQRVLVEPDGLELPLAHPDALVVANAGAAAFVRDLLRRRAPRTPGRSRDRALGRGTPEPRRRRLGGGARRARNDRLVPRPDRGVRRRDVARGLEHDRHRAFLVRSVPRRCPARAVPRHGPRPRAAGDGAPGLGGAGRRRCARP